MWCGDGSTGMFMLLFHLVSNVSVRFAGGEFPEFDRLVCRYVGAYLFTLSLARGGRLFVTGSMLWSAGAILFMGMSVGVGMNTLPFGPGHGRETVDKCDDVLFTTRVVVI